MKVNSIINTSYNQNFGRCLDNDARCMAKDICYTRGTKNKNIKDPDVYTMSFLDNSKLVELYSEKDKKGKKVLKAKVNKNYIKKHNIDYDVESERAAYRMEHDLWFRNVGNYNSLYHLGRFARAFAVYDYYTTSEYDVLAKSNMSTDKTDMLSDHDIAEQYLRDRGMYDM